MANILLRFLIKHTHLLMLALPWILSDDLPRLEGFHDIAYKIFLTPSRSILYHQN